jgi:chromosomal replication initiation ATPase DnaA
MIAQAEYEIDLRYPVGHVCRVTKMPIRIELGANPTAQTVKVKLRDIHEIAFTVCQMLDLNIHHVLSGKRDTELLHARVVISYVAHKHGYSSTKIGKYMSRDHSSILNNLEKARTILFEKKPEHSHLIKLIYKLA